MSITLAFAVAQVSLYFNCSALFLKPNYLDYFYYYLFVWYNHNPSIISIGNCRHQLLFTEINFDYFYFYFFSIVKERSYLILCFRFERTNLNSARAIHICFFSIQPCSF
jgi:hypothetical protein